MRTALALVLWAGMTAVLVAAFFVVQAPPPPEAGGGFNAPQATRILFLHVPAAELCTVAFVLALWHGILFLRSRNPLNDVRSMVAARLGVVFGGLALVMGMAWANVEWGAAWNWDPRQTGLALALLTYMAYFALRGSVEDPEKQGVLAAVYAILACPTALFLVFGLPRFLPSLHLRPGEVDLSSAFSWTMAGAMLAFTGLFAWIYNLETRITLRERLEYERHTP